MPTSVIMPRLGESVTEGTVTRWLKGEGDHVDADEPLLEVSTDKVDTEVPSPASGTVLAIRVHEDETVDIGVELAVIGDAGGETVGAEPDQAAAPAEAQSGQAVEAQAATAPPSSLASDASGGAADASATGSPTDANPPGPAPYAGAGPQPGGGSYPVPAAGPEPESGGTSAATPVPQSTPAPASNPGPSSAAPADDDDVAGTYVTPLVRKLAAEHGVDLNAVSGTGVGGRIRKSDVLAAAESARSKASAPHAAAPQAATAAATAPPAAAPPVASAEPAHAATPTGPTAPTAPTAPASSVAPQATSAAAATTVRGRVEPMSRMRQVIATRMVESLQTSAQLTTVVEVDVTRIARLREQTKTAFAAREGVKLSFLPFFAVAAVEALKAHPIVNASVDMAARTVTYHEAEHLGIAVDTERGLLVPVIHDAGDLNLAGVARKIADLAERTRANKVSPDELGGGTFTLTNTGSRGALFDTPIINQPQVAILGTGAVVKRPVVISDADLGETIAVRSMVYLALSYDHRIVDGADAARFLATMKHRLEAGAFERALGLG